MTTLESVQRGVRAQRRQADDALAAAERAILPTSAAGDPRPRRARPARQALAADTGAALDEPVRLIGPTPSTPAGSRPRPRRATPPSSRRRSARSPTRAEAITPPRPRARRVGRRAHRGRRRARQDDRRARRRHRQDQQRDPGGHAPARAVSPTASARARGAAARSPAADARSAVKGLSGSDSARAAAAPASASASFFDSGYFLLAALESDDSAPIGVNVDHGGQGARIVVVPRYPASDPRTRGAVRAPARDLGRLGRSLGADTAVGGPAAMLPDYDAVAASACRSSCIVLTLVTALLLGILLRSVVVPIVGVVLNLLAVGATLGLLALLFQGDNAAARRPRRDRRRRGHRDLRRRLRPLDRLPGVHPQPRPRGVAARRRRGARAASRPHAHRARRHRRRARA